MISELDDGDTSEEITDLLDRDFSLDIEPTDAEVESFFRKGEFGGRSKAGRQMAVRKYGGTAEMSTLSVLHTR